MCRNGTDFGIRVSGTGDRWFTAPVEMPVGLYFPGFCGRRRQPGHGRFGHRRDHRPRRLRHGGGAGGGRIRRRRSAAEAAVFTQAMREITVGENPHWTIPALDFAGVPPASTSAWWSRPASRRPSIPASPTGSRASARSAPAWCGRRSRASARRCGARRTDRGRHERSICATPCGAASISTSVALMRISREIAALPGVEEAALMIGTPANKEILREAGMLGPDGPQAGASDLILAVRAQGGRSGRRGACRGAALCSTAAERRRRCRPPAAAQLCAARSARRCRTPTWR